MIWFLYETNLKKADLIDFNCELFIGKVVRVDMDKQTLKRKNCLQCVHKNCPWPFSNRKSQH